MCAANAQLVAHTALSFVQISEENDDPVNIEEIYRGQYCVVMDPLDGSSNIDCGVSIGTIFGIYRIQPGSQGSVSDVLRVCLLIIDKVHKLSFAGSLMALQIDPSFCVNGDG